MIELPNKKKCYNLQEQVAQNLLNIRYLAEQYKNIDALPTIWQTYKEEFDSELETFGEWTTTFEGWTESLNTYLANMSSAAVGALAGQDVSVRTIEQTTANWSGAINIELHPNLNTCILTKLYCRAQKINQKLSIVLNFSIENDTGADISFNSRARIVDMYNSIPAAIASKLYDMLGQTVADISSPDYILIASAKCFCYDGANPISANAIYNNLEIVLTNRSFANVFNISVLSDGENLTFENGKTYYFTGRITLDLL